MSPLEKSFFIQGSLLPKLLKQRLALLQRLCLKHIDHKGLDSSYMCRNISPRPSPIPSQRSCKMRLHLALRQLNWAVPSRTVNSPECVPNKTWESINDVCVYIYIHTHSVLGDALGLGARPLWVDSVCTVLVFSLWELLVPRVPASSGSLGLCPPPTSICLIAPWTLLGFASVSSRNLAETGHTTEILATPQGRHTCYLT